MARVVLQLLGISIVAAGVAFGGDSGPQDDPFPELEFTRAQQHMISRLGKTLVESSVRFVEGGRVRSGNDFSGYFASYVFIPPTAPDLELRIRLESEYGEEYSLVGPWEVPNCVEDSSLCDVAISGPMAVELVNQSGFVATKGTMESRLRIYGAPSRLVWRIAETYYPLKKGLVGPVYFVNTSTGAIEDIVEGKVN